MNTTENSDRDPDPGLPDRGAAGRAARDSRTGAGPGPGAGRGRGGRHLRVGRALLRSRPDRRLRRPRTTGAGPRGVGHDPGRGIGGHRPGRRSAGGHGAAGDLRPVPGVPVRALQPVSGRPLLRHPADPRRVRPVRDLGGAPGAPGAGQPVRRGRCTDRAPVGRRLGRAEGQHPAGGPGAGHRGRAGRPALRGRRAGPRRRLGGGQRHQRLPAGGGRGSRRDSNDQRSRRPAGRPDRAGRCGPGVQRGHAGRAVGVRRGTRRPPGSCWSASATRRSSCRWR